MNAQQNDYRKMIEYAIKAPSGHNTQPWKFKINENSIDIIPDFSKTLPVVDNDNRELFISLGCAAENLCITASTRSYHTKMTVTEKGIITIHLQKDSSIKPDVLFDEIEKRQTNRGVYNSEYIEDDLLKDCLSVVPSENGIYAYCWKYGTPEFEKIRELIVEGNTIQMDDTGFVEELKSWMRFNKKHSLKKMDGLSYNVFGAPNLPMFISKPAMGSYLNSKKQNKGDIKKIDSSSHFVILASKDNTITEWILLGRYMERFLLKTTAVGIAHTYMNQPCEVAELRPKLREVLAINKQHPQIVLRLGYAKQAAYSKRKNIEEVLITE